MVGLVRFGGYATFVVADARLVFKVVGNQRLEQAADLMGLVASRLQEYLDKNVLKPIRVIVFSNQELMKVHELL